MVKASAGNWEVVGSSLVRYELRPSQTDDFKIGTLVATSLDVSIMRLVPGLVGPVSVYCDWVGYFSCVVLIPQCGPNH